MKRRSKAGGKADKADRRTAATPKRSTSPKAVPGRRSSPSSHDTEMARIIRERDEALERETGTAEVLRVISASSGELQPVFDAMLANATRLCQANFGTLNLNEGDKTTVVAMQMFRTPSQSSGVVNRHSSSDRIIPWGVSSQQNG